MKYVFLALFILFSLVHLYGSYLNNQKIRNITKGGILLFLLGYYVCAAPSVSWIVILALVFSLLGDVALMINGGFAVGGISFMISHVFFILAYLPNVSLAAAPWYALVPLVLVYGAAVFFVFRELKDHIPHKLYYPMLLYLVVNGAMNVFAFMQLLSVPCLASALVFIGAALFFFSDSTLFIVRFHKTKMVWRRHFLVMLSYILAEFLIVQGLIMLAA